MEGWGLDKRVRCLFKFEAEAAAGSGTSCSEVRLGCNSMFSHGHSASYHVLLTSGNAASLQNISKNGSDMS